MATAFQPPPTYALPILVDEKTGRAQFSPIWLKWFVDMAQVLSSFGGGSGSADHNLLGNLQGGASSQYYHLNLADFTQVTGEINLPATIAINQMLVSTVANAVTALATANSSVLVTDSSGVPAFGTALPDVTTAGNNLVRKTTTLADGAAAAAGTLLNAPAAGNPTKWVPIDDNGVTRYIPAW